MGYLRDGRYTTEAFEMNDSTGRFVRDPATIRDVVTSDGTTPFPAASGGRYRLYAGQGCPWAHRTLIYHALKRLDGIVDVRLVDPFMGREGWCFSTPDQTSSDPVVSARQLHEVYSVFAPTYRYDSRDNPFDTTRGNRATLSLAYSGGPLGGTINQFKPVLNLSHFRRLSRNGSVSANFEGGYILPHNDSDCTHYFAEIDATDDNPGNDTLCIPQSERFYVGGYQSVRGFDSYSIGPTERLNGRDVVVGGYSYSVFNLEYVHKINDPLRLVLFADAGNAYGYKETWDFADLRYSAGVEMRIFLPVFQFPLRFIYAFNPDPQPGDQFDSFSFSIGNTY